MLTYATLEDFNALQKKTVTLAVGLTQANKNLAKQIGKQKDDLNEKIEKIEENLNEQSNNLSKKIQGITESLPSSGRIDFSEMDNLLKGFQEEEQSLYSPNNVEVA